MRKSEVETLWNTDTLFTWYRNSVTGNVPVQISNFFKSVCEYFLSYTCKFSYIFLWSKACLDVPNTASWLKIAFPKEGEEVDMKANTIQSLKIHSVKMLAWFIQTFKTLNIKHARNATEPSGFSSIDYTNKCCQCPLLMQIIFLFKWEISFPLWNS